MVVFHTMRIDKFDDNKLKSDFDRLYAKLELIERENCLLKKFTTAMNDLAIHYNLIYKSVSPIQKKETILPSTKTRLYSNLAKKLVLANQSINSNIYTAKNRNSYSINESLNRPKFPLGDSIHYNRKLKERRCIIRIPERQAKSQLSDILRMNKIHIGTQDILRQNNSYDASNQMEYFNKINFSTERVNTIQQRNLLINKRPKKIY